MTLEELIAEANKRGYRVINLFQLKNDTWQGNVCWGEKYSGPMFEMGYGNKPIEALTQALEKADWNTPRELANPLPEKIKEDSWL